MKRTAALALVLASSIIVACRGGGGGGGDDTTGDDAPSGDMTIQDVQNDSMAAGTPVTLHGVVVTAIDTYGAKTGDFWVEEPGGGPFSGVHVFGAELADVGALAVGDIVDITSAQKDEFTYQGSNGSGGDTSGRSLTEVEPINGGKMKVTKTGTGSVPAAQAVDALAIGQKATQAERDAEWEKWEGVLITVTNVSATNTPKCIGSACSDDTADQFDITGGVVLESTLAAFPGYMPKMGSTPAVPSSIKSGDCLGSATGVVDYFFDYLLLTTSTTGVMTGGTSCPAAEAAAQCSDGIDNDGNGFADCMDRSCLATAPSCSVATTIPAIQTTTPTGAVTLMNVYVTAISHSKRSIWVSTDLAAAPNNGIYVFNANQGAVLDASIAVGSKVNVTGTVQEYNDDTMGGTLTEFSGATTTLVTAAGTVVPVAGKTAADLLVPATAPTYESVLVTLTNVNIGALGSTANGFIATATQSGTTFGVGTDVIQLAAADMGCHATVTGLWTNLEASSTGATTKPNAFGFIVTSMSAVGGTCN